VKPHIIVTLGNTPTKALLNSKKPISQIRGRWQDYRGVKLMPTFNPAYLLRDPTKKREVWEDMKLVRTELVNPSN
jgi:DNA polymerase